MPVRRRPGPAPSDPAGVSLRVQLVEDDDDLRAVIAAGLREAGFAVDGADDWPEADVMLHVTAYDCVLLDRMLPSGDSLARLEDRRRAGWAVPVLRLTALDALDERLHGLESAGRTTTSPSPSRCVNSSCAYGV